MSWRATGKALKHIRSARGVNKKIPEPIKKWNIKKGDTVFAIDLCAIKICRPASWCMTAQVQILAGQDKGKQGKVVVVDRNFNRLYVQGLNTVSPTQNWFTGI